MKIKLLSIASILAIFSFSLVFTSCDETQQDLFEANIETAEDFVYSEVAFLDAFNIVFRTANDSLVQADGNNTIDNASVSLSGNTLTIEFGNTEIESFDKMRSGTITANLTAPNLNTSGVVATLSFTDYTVDGNAIDGDATITNSTASGNRIFDMAVTNAEIITTDMDTLSYASNKTLEQTAGQSTNFFFNDDVFDLTGNASGKSGKGSAYTATVTQTVNLDFTCKWKLTSGKLTLTTTEYFAPALVDFGNGDCDNKGSVTLEDENGGVYVVPFTLK